MHNLAEKGTAIIMVSSDMEEVLGVSDRIAVMCSGEITGFLDKKDFSDSISKVWGPLITMPNGKKKKEKRVAQMLAVYYFKIIVY